jgi:hypothetical protein
MPRSINGYFGNAEWGYQFKKCSILSSLSRGCDTNQTEIKRPSNDYTTSCEVGYEQNATLFCSQCAKDYYRFQGECKACEGAGKIINLLQYVALLLAYAASGLRCVREHACARAHARLPGLSSFCASLSLFLCALVRLSACLLCLMRVCACMCSLGVTSVLSQHAMRYGTEWVRSKAAFFAPLSCPRF